MNKIRKCIAIFLAAATVAMFVGGCGAAGGEGGDSNSSADGSGTGSSDSPSAMGRYVEEVTDLSDKIFGSGNGLCQLENGDLLILEKSRELLKSKDNGATWTVDTREWWTKMLNEGVYVLSMAVGPDNTVAMLRQVDVETSEDDIEADDTESEMAEEKTDTDEYSSLY